MALNFVKKLRQICKKVDTLITSWIRSVLVSDLITERFFLVLGPTTKYFERICPQIAFLKLIKNPVESKVYKLI